MHAAPDVLPCPGGASGVRRVDAPPNSRSTTQPRELRVLDHVLAAVRSGQSQVLVVSGEAGIGKTTVLEQLVARATGCRTLCVAGVESEADLPYSGLHQALISIGDVVERLPQPQREALAAVFGLESGPAPDPFLVGLATSTLLTASDEPLLCVVDDAHLLDSASLKALAFVARRMRDTDGVAMVFALRELATCAELAGLPEVRVPALSDSDARALLASVLVAPVDGLVRDRIVAEARGNPRLLLDLPAALSAVDATAGFTAAPRFVDEADAGVVRRLDALPAMARRALVVAAAEPVGDAGVFWRALEGLRIDRGAVDALETAGLVEVGQRVRFRHPSIRSAAYHTACLRERKDVHAALASATDAHVDRDRRAWHRALAAYGPDDDVASELEAASEQAMKRAGIAAAAVLLDHAATLTPEPARRADRLLAAARAKREAGSLGAARLLVVEAEAISRDQRRLAELTRVRGQLALDEQLPTEAVRFLSEAVSRLQALDPRQAREAHLEALLASTFAGSPHDVAEAAIVAPAASGPPRLLDHLLEALALRVAKGQPDAAPILRRALTQAECHTLTDVEAEAACMVAVEVWDPDALQRLATARTNCARSAGALLHLQRSLDLDAALRVLTGATHQIADLVADGRACAEACGLESISQAAVLAAAFRGDEAATSAGVEALLAEASRKGHGRLKSVATYSRAVLANGLGHYESACEATRDLFDDDPVGLGPFVVSEVIEAASRIADHDLLQNALAWVTERADATPTDWSLGLADRIRALTSGGDVTDRLHRRSLERLDRTPLRIELARGRLLYGEWLRREGRRIDARAQLGAAHDAFDGAGLDAFALRARRELRATGETARKRSDETRLALTPQEAEIARLAGEGLTNSEIGAQLFIGARTVEWHLRKIFAKLGVTTRRQLRHRYVTAM